ncbi:MAG: SMP-30/gluconolactonase/LRE family protein [Deltaproteobacteria bacterium]|nr:SMP-30/gluconolactonase/LRE family protein [Deltaproteobacteria bacterium]
MLVHDLDDGGRAHGRREIRLAAGQPDGMAVDEIGAVWVAMYSGARADRYRPDGTFDRRSARNVRSATTPCRKAKNRSSVPPHPVEGGRPQPTPRGGVS